MAPSALDRVLDKVERVKAAGSGSWLASCPVPGHGQGRGDKNPSLSIAYKDGKVLLSCMGSCHVQDVLLALGLDWPDLWDEPYGKRPVTIASWTYQRPDGTIHFTVERQQDHTGKRFVQRVPGLDRAGYPANFKPCLYRLPQVLAQAKAGGEVYIVEGEKSVHAAESLGLVATTSPNGAKAWKDYYSTWLKGCSRVTIVCDNDEAGHTYAAGVAVSLRGKAIPVRTVKVAVETKKADLYDHVLAGYTERHLVPFKVNRLRPPGTTATELLTNVYPPVQWAVRGLLPTGFAVLGGPPKLGKSLVVSSLAVGVAVGGHALHYLECEQGSVLYLSLDNDSERRLQWRVKQIIGPDTYAMVPIEFHCEWPTGDQAVKACQEWIDDERDDKRRPLLIVVDTLAKAEPHFEGRPGENGYLTSTSTLSAWSRMATDNDVCVLAVHHDKKGAEDDWVNRFTGSRGITATAQTLLLLDSKRGEDTGHLRVAGRDVGTNDYPIERSGLWWRLTDEAAAELQSETSRNDMAKPHLSIVGQET